MQARFPLWLRWVLAGPVTLAIAIATMASSSTIGGDSEMPSFNALAFAMISFPAFWGAMFFYVLLEERPLRAVVVSSILVAVNAVYLYSVFS